MSQSTSKKSGKRSTSNQKIASSIVHKPFSTGKINIFNPPRSNPNGEHLPAKLIVNAVLEKPEPIPEKPEIPEKTPKNWFNNLLNPWTISAIAILLSANFISGWFIWQRSPKFQAAVNPVPEPATIGNSNLAQREFIPLNLSTLSTIKTAIDTAQDVEESEKITPDAPIHPAFMPSSFNSKYHYVLTEYTGDRSLKLARQKVSSVSLVNFPQGVFIYLGAFSEKTQANAFINQLKQEGIDAYVYPF